MSTIFDSLRVSQHPQLLIVIELSVPINCDWGRFTIWSWILSLFAKLKALYSINEFRSPQALHSRILKDIMEAYNEFGVVFIRFEQRLEIHYNGDVEGTVVSLVLLFDGFFLHYFSHILLRILLSPERDKILRFKSIQWLFGRL